MPALEYFRTEKFQLHRKMPMLENSSNGTQYLPNLRKIGYDIITEVSEPSFNKMTS